MKISLRVAFLMVFSVLCVAALVSCSGGQKYNKNVNVKALAEQLKSPDKDQRTDACTKLAEGGPFAAEAVSALTEALKDPEPLVRSLAAYALGEIGPQAASAIPALKELLNDSDIQVPPSAINAIRAIDPKSAPKLGLQEPVTGPAPQQ